MHISAQKTNPIYVSNLFLPKPTTFNGLLCDLSSIS